MDDNGVPSIGGEHIGSDGRVLLKGMKYIPRIYYESMNRGRIHHGDILIVKDGATTGKAGFVDDDFPYNDAAVNEHVFIVRTRSKLLEPKFAFYWLFSPKGNAQILSDFRGSAQGGIARSFASCVKMPLPPLSEQRRIVEILDQADALRKKRAEADAKAARILPALFYKMFGDPLALISSSEGVPISDLEVDLQNGFACGEKDVEDGVPHLRMNNIDDAGVLNLELVRTVPFDRDTERYRLIEKDVLFMGTNSEDKIGKTCLFLPPDERTYLFSNHLIRLRVSDSRITPEYLASFLHLLWSKRFFPSIAKRWVNQSAVAQSSLAALRIPLPGERSLQMFTTAFQNLLSLRAQRVRSGETLDQTFAVLLHRAFTGDLTVKWREAHMKELLQEMEQQAKALNLSRSEA